MRTGHGLYILLFASVAFAFAVNEAYAETQISSTDGDTLDVQLEYDPIYTNAESKINVEFLNPYTQKTQVHVDYTITITRDGETVFGPTSPIHTSPGVISVPIQFQSEGIHSIAFSVDGIMFQPIPAEFVSFDIVVKSEALPAWIKTNAGWWADGMIDDDTFVSALEYLIQTGIIVVPTDDGDDDIDDADVIGNGNNNNNNNDVPSSPQIPPWIKTNAGWWADGMIDDDTFVSALQYLIAQGVLQI